MHEVFAQFIVTHRNLISLNGGYTLTVWLIQFI